MASSSSVLQDDSWLSRADRALLPVERVFASAQRLGRIFTHVSRSLLCVGPQIFQSTLEWLRRLYRGGHAGDCLYGSLLCATLSAVIFVWI